MGNHWKNTAIKENVRIRKGSCKLFELVSYRLFVTLLPMILTSDNEGTSVKT